LEIVKGVPPSYEGVPETACVKPPKREIKFFGGSLGIDIMVYSIRTSMVGWQYAIVYIV
jgi:hypothetical protein